MVGSNEKQITYPVIGNVTFIKKKGLRRASIVVKPFKGVIVTVPYSVSIADAERFVLQKQDWIVEAKQKMAKLEARKTLFTEDTPFKTRKRALCFVRHEPVKQQVTARITADTIKISIPEGLEVTSDAVQAIVLKAVERAWEVEAKELLPERVKELARINGFAFEQLRVKRIKSRWGSCSSTNNINLSIYLMNLPDHLIDYVILHELCHTIEKNHGAGFWKLLDKVSGGRAKAFAKEMKNYSTRYF